MIQEPLHAQAGTAEAEEPEKPWPQQPFRRGWRFNWPGVVLMAIYCLAFIFYLYIRIRYTLDLGSYVWCGPPYEAALHPKYAQNMQDGSVSGGDRPRPHCCSLLCASKQPVDASAAQTTQRSSCIYTVPPTAGGARSCWVWRSWAPRPRCCTVSTSSSRLCMSRSSTTPPTPA